MADDIGCGACAMRSRLRGLTVAALDGSAVDHQTTRQLVGGLSPSVLAPLCAVSFRESPNVGQLLSTEFAEGFKSISGDAGPQTSRRAAELAARRDLLAQELESRISTERRASNELETRWRELDRRARDEQQQLASLEQRLQSVRKIAGGDRCAAALSAAGVECRAAVAGGRRPGAGNAADGARCAN